jgi:purine nucleoside permease
MRSLFPLLLLSMLPFALAQPPQKPIEIKVVVINMFEVGADTGDAPGEHQYWVEREDLDTVI